VHGARSRPADLDWRELAGSPTEFREFIRAETKKWAEMIKFAGIKAQ
jgi:tripartite-type tricarboxylate transporter receptor subunit TctC